MSSLLVILLGKGTISIKFDRALHQKDTLFFYDFSNKSSKEITLIFFLREGGEAVFVMKDKRVQYLTDCFVAESLSPITNINFPT